MSRLRLTELDLIKCTTQDLKKLLDDGQITMSEHHEYRRQRRRLQNRKYARKCAQKKQEEIFGLSERVKQEVDEVDSLRDQLEKMVCSTDRVARQIRMVRELLKEPLKGQEEQRSPLTTKHIRILSETGAALGSAYIVPQPITSSQRGSPQFIARPCSSSVGAAHNSGVSHDRVFVRPAGGGFNTSCRGLSDF
ncbi:hypothetical protein Ciccas_000917 [Cichlidogyrus casuarinus]|uniref:BZIP domain-containing protein n=1 Tax=Cichlidogyrus casuarinus TaxID=1844966 RepID=A0ABD2QNU2_9PLAT